MRRVGLKNGEIEGGSEGHEGMAEKEMGSSKAIQNQICFNFERLGAQLLVITHAHTDAKNAITTRCLCVAVCVLSSVNVL